MKYYISVFIFSFFQLTALLSSAQSITYSEVEKADSRNMNFEILGNFSNNYLVYKNLILALQNPAHEFASAADGLKTVEIIEKIYATL